MEQSYTYSIWQDGTAKVVVKCGTELLLIDCGVPYSSSEDFKESSPASFTKTVAHENDREPYLKNPTGPLNPLSVPVTGVSHYLAQILAPST